MITYSGRDIAERLNARALVTFTTSGDTGRRMARLHSPLPLLIFTPHQHVRSRLALTWGAETFLCDSVETVDEMMAEVDRQLLALPEYDEGDLIVVIAGTPPGVSGNTNLIQVHILGEEVSVPKEKHDQGRTL